MNDNADDTLTPGEVAVRMNQFARMAATHHTCGGMPGCAACSADLHAKVAAAEKRAEEAERRVAEADESLQTVARVVTGMGADLAAANAEIERLRGLPVRLTFEEWGSSYEYPRFDAWWEKARVGLVDTLDTRNAARRGFIAARTMGSTASRAERAGSDHVCSSCVPCENCGNRSCRAECLKELPAATKERS